MTTVTAPALAGQQFLRGMDASHLAFLAEVSTVVNVPAGHRFFTAGGLAHRFWLIRAGQVALDLRAPGDGRVVVEALGRGEMVGLSWFLPPFRWEFGAVALQPTELFEFDAEAVRDRCEQDPDFGYQLTRRMMGVVLRRLQASRARMMDLRAERG